MARGNPVPKVGVVMGSESDWEIMQHAVAQFVAFAKLLHDFAFGNVRRFLL